MNEAHGYLTRQLEMVWQLTDYHLDGLSTEECLWRPTAQGLHVWPRSDGSWQADWPEHEGYDLGPSSLAWLTWHLGFWLSMLLDHAKGAGTLTREAVTWPGDAESMRSWVTALKDEWLGLLSELDDADLRESQRTRWPFQGRPFGDLVAWSAVELTKSAAEIGYARFLYAARR